MATSSLPREPVRLDRLAIARALRDMARLLELAGAEPFKARAYERGARVLERLAMARRGWTRRDEVLNTLDTEAFARAVSPSARG
jgi:hypothetical protein